MHTTTFRQSMPLIQGGRIPSRYDRRVVVPQRQAGSVPIEQPTVADSKQFATFAPQEPTAIISPATSQIDPVASPKPQAKLSHVTTVYRSVSLPSKHAKAAQEKNNAAKKTLATQQPISTDIPTFEKVSQQADASRSLAHTARRAEVLSRVVAQQQPAKTKKHHRIRSWHAAVWSRQGAAGLLVALIVMSTGYVTIDTWLTNRQVVEATTSTAAHRATGETRSTEQARGEGRDETPLAANAVAEYSVAADKPRMLSIDKLGVKARILPVGVNTDNSMQAPNNVYDTGWYNASSVPGELGAVVLNGHSSGATKQGVFGRLTELKKGDTLSIEKGDRSVVRYRVIKTETVDRKKVDMREFLLPHGAATRGANFMTCTGDWEKDNSTMKQRFIVYTEQIR